MATTVTDDSLCNSNDELIPPKQELDLEALKALDNNRTKSKLRKNLSLSWLSYQCQLASSRGGSALVGTDVGLGEDALFKYYTGDRSKLTFLEKQTFQRWKSMTEFERVKHPRRHRRRSILIQPISWKKKGKENGSDQKEGSMGYSHDSITGTILDYLRQFCAAFYTGMEVKVCPEVDLSAIPHLTSRIHSSTNRRQFLVDDIINYLKRNVLKRCYCVLGVTVVDLYPGPEWNFVLGQACFEKGCGVLSFGRYFNNDCVPLPVAVSELSSMALGSDHQNCSKELEMQQLRNIYVLMRGVSHELGHLFGLAHCHYFQCAMNESSSIIEATSQPLFLCPVCLCKVVKVLRCDLEARYTAMMEVIKDIRLEVLNLPADRSELKPDKARENGVSPSVVATLVTVELSSGRAVSHDSEVDSHDPKAELQELEAVSYHSEDVSLQSEPEVITNEPKTDSQESGTDSHQPSSVVNQLAMLDNAIAWLERGQSSLGNYYGVRTPTKRSRPQSSFLLCCV